MTIARIKSPGWGANEKLTSGQQNALDINTTYALDKRAGQTDTLSSVITVASGGALSFALGSSFVTIAGATSVFGGQATFNGATLVNGALSVVGASQFLGAVSLFGAVAADNFTLTTTNRVKLASRSITRTITALFVPVTSNWAFGTAATPTTTDALYASGYFAINLPDGAVLNSISVYIEGAAGHAGAPTTMPTVQLISKAPAAGGNGVAVTSAVTGTYGSPAAYEAPHAITLSTIAYTVTRAATRLCLLVTSELGANAIAGFKVHGCIVTYTTTSLDDGPSN